MNAILQRIDDPRDALTRARRETELIPFLRANGIDKFTFAGREFTINNAPAEIMRAYLRERHLTHIPIRPRQLGAPPGYVDPGVRQGPVMPNQTPPDIAEFAKRVDTSPPPFFPEEDGPPRVATPATPAAPKAVANMSIVELRHYGRDVLGIQFERKDNKITMRAKIEEKLAANG